MNRRKRFFLGLSAIMLALSTFMAPAQTDVFLLEVPDYEWYAGCFGTASGNLMGYWDRNGFPDFYTGPTARGVAPINSRGANAGIFSMWCSKAGMDGRPANQPGHVDDYWLFYNGGELGSYESTAPDPYVTAGRPEHKADCIGDFIGMSQRKWTNMNNECDGNIDAYSFVFWDRSGNKRTNYVASGPNGETIPDVPSGLREWTKYRGFSAEVITQLTDFNPNVPAGKGFTYEDLKAEIDAGYPVLLFMQSFNQSSRPLSGMPKANPAIHGMLAYGYISDPESGLEKGVRYRTSWASGDLVVSEWGPGQWQAGLPIRGVILYHPLPQIKAIARTNGTVTVTWNGPRACRFNSVSSETTNVSRYVVERATSLDSQDFRAVTEPTTEHSATFADCCDEPSFFRVRLLRL